jgi:type I restriction-modification system DNA methylase subunit
MADIDSFKEKLQTLIQKFEKDKNHYLSKNYLEAQVRIDFINPLFKALGWDIENKAHKPPHERDVIVEISPETTGRPDYNFRVNERTKFFVEAKAPSVALDNTHHIMQAKSYAWSTKEVYFVILTDFEEFRLYDASLKPNPQFPDEGLIYNLSYKEYLSKIEKLWELSRESVEQGSLEALIPRDTKSKRLRIPPDKTFLEDLTKWRIALAKDIHKRNPDFDVRLLNDVVQKLLDRIIFARIAEDRRIRPDRELWEIAAQWKEEGRRKSIMSHLLELFREVNTDLNGDIFKPHACEMAHIDSGLLADIIESLYFPRSRYRFDAIGVELLGSIYERYLGNTIRVTAQRVKVEEKPEVRKAGGVYYTPKYIVDYIVKNTVGKLIEGKTPKQIEKIKILDPACGSGSFLLGAYQYLLDYHIRYYLEHPKDAQTLHLDFYTKINPEDFTLPLREKARILRNNIYGVDIDPQAVEITKMSLYLKALEGERGLLPKKQHLLPPLNNNIKCGNSLIGYDIYDGLFPLSKGGKGVVKKGSGQAGMTYYEGTVPVDGLSDEDKSRINPFDWHSKSAGFGEILQPNSPLVKGETTPFNSPLVKGDRGLSEGGFDCVIGNPPYVRIQAMKEWAPVEVELYKKLYASASRGNYDIYVVFVEKGLSLLNPKGRLGFILPHKFFQSQFGEPLREIVSKGKHLSEVVHFGDRQVFEGVTTYTCLMFLDKAGSKKCDFIKVKDLAEWIKGNGTEEGKIPANTLTKSKWNFVIGQSSDLFNRLREMPVKLGDIANIFVGLQTSADRIYVLSVLKWREHSIQCYSKSLQKEVEIEKDLVKPFLMGKDVHRYQPPVPKNIVIFPYKIHNGKAILMPQSFIKENFPKGWEYLLENKKELSYREKGRMKGDNFYAYIYPKNLTAFEAVKIMTPDICNGTQMTIDDNNLYHTTTIYSFVFKDTIRESQKYFLGILNSKLLWFFLQLTGTILRGGFMRFKTEYLKPFPIRIIDFNNPSEKAIHDRLVSLVDRMLELHKKKSSIPPSAEREKTEREIAVTDEKIDDIVYGLYGVTEGERKIIEGNLE